MESFVDAYSLKGFGIASGYEVAHTVVGDKISFDITREKRLPKKGRLLEVLNSSKYRVVPRCAHANVCGGCSWQQVDYDEQLRVKQKRVEDCFEGQTVDPIISAPSQFYYRNKMEFSFSQNRAGTKYLGLMIAQAEPYVFNLSECHLVNPWMQEVVVRVRTWWENSNVAAFNGIKDTGALRYLTLRESFRGKEKMAILNVSGNPEFALTKTEIDSFIQAVGDGVSIFLRIHQTKKGKPTNFFEMHLSGKDHIMENLVIAGKTLSFKISPISFFQPNTFACEKLYETAISFLEKEDVVFDLYSGTGTISMIAAKKAKKVVSIELSPEAVLDAEENAIRNGIENITFHQGDVGKVLKAMKAKGELIRPDAIIVDPPRAGLDETALEQLIGLHPRKIIYISCNPITQGQNVGALKNAGYKIKRLQPVDQFPHTYHIENIAFLER